MSVEGPAITAAERELADLLVEVLNLEARDPASIDPVAPLFSDQGEDFVDVPSEEAIRLGLDAVMKSVRLQLRTAPDDQVQKLKTPGARVVAWAHERHSEQPQETAQ